MTSVLSQFTKKKEVKKLLQAPLPPRYQTQEVIKTHLLRLKMTTHVAHPKHGEQDEKPARGTAAAAIRGEHV